MLANGNGVQGSYSDDDAGKFLQMVIAPNENESRNRVVGKMKIQWCLYGGNACRVVLYG